MVECNDESRTSEIKELNSASNSKKTLTNSEILSQSIIFLLAGTDTTTTTLCWISHNLAMNPECQERLIKEVDSELEKYVIFN
jgi:cytochrome P450